MTHEQKAKGMLGYKEAFFEALSNDELIHHYDRLRGTSLGECLKSMSQGGINYEIDLHTGRIKDEILKFDEFFNEYIWIRISKNETP